MIMTGTLFGLIEILCKNFLITLIWQTTKGWTISGTITKYFLIYFQLTRKDLLIKNLKRYKKNMEKEAKLEEV